MTMQEKLAASESELQHVRATAQAEFTRVQGEVAKAFKVGQASELRANTCWVVRFPCHRPLSATET